MKPIRTILALLAFVGMAACATPGALDSGMTQEEFLAADTGEREAEIKRIQTEAEALEEWRKVRFLAGHPVKFEFEGTGFTAVCRKPPGNEASIAIYGGHDAPGMNRATHQELVVFAADENCVGKERSIPGDTTGETMPVVLVNNATAQEDFWRMASRSAIPGFTNGVGLQLTKEVLGNPCPNGCGPSYTIQGGTAVAGAETNTMQTTGVALNAYMGSTPTTPTCSTCVSDH